MPIYAEDVADVVAGTLARLDKGHYQQIAQSLQEYMVVPKWLKKHKKQYSSGYKIKANQVFRSSSPARMSGFTDPIGNNIPDLLSSMEVPWKHADTYFVVVYQTDICMNSGPEEIVNIIKVRDADSYLSLAGTLEAQVFGTAPAVADETAIYGLKYWLVQNATAGFNGGLPNDHTTVGGVNITTNSTFKNYTATFPSITDRNFMPVVRTALRKINFKSPSSPEQMRTFGENYTIYTNEEGLSGLEALADKRNDNPGRELLPFWNGVRVRGNECVRVPYLDADTNKPFYFVNHETFYPVVLKGDDMRQTVQKAWGDQINLTRTILQITLNILCIDRRRNAVIYQA